MGTKKKNTFPTDTGQRQELYRKRLFRFRVLRNGKKEAGSARRESMTLEELEYIRDLNTLGYINDEAYRMIFTKCKPTECRDAISRDDALQCVLGIENLGDMFEVVDRIKKLKSVVPVDKNYHASF